MKRQKRRETDGSGFFSKADWKKAVPRDCARPTVQGEVLRVTY